MLFNIKNKVYLNVNLIKITLEYLILNVKWNVRLVIIFTNHIKNPKLNPSDNSYIFINFN